MCSSTNGGMEFFFIKFTIMWATLCGTGRDCRIQTQRIFRSWSIDVELSPARVVMCVTVRLFLSRLRHAILAKKKWFISYFD